MVKKKTKYWGCSRNASPVKYILGKDTMKLTIERYKGIYSRIVTELSDELIIALFWLVITGFMGGRI